jgi:hypothetical protein
MKRLIFMGIALALVVGLIWVPAVAAGEADIIIHKAIDEGCPEETFHFEAWRDMNGNGVIDAGDTLQGTVDITGAGTGVITVGILGKYVVREVLEVGSIYEPHPDQPVFIACDEHVYFDNTCEFELCDLVILKTDTAGDPLSGACFTITPDPRTGTDSLVLCDNDANDECSADGVFFLSELICGLNCTVEETTVPDGYEGADPQTVIIGETLELTFVNTERTTDCGTVCAAQTAPGEFLFDPAKQENWFTWIYYGIGWGSDVAPYTYPIYTGQDKLCGTLYVYDNGSHIFVNYVLTDMDGCTLVGLSDYHLQVDSTFADLKGTIYKGKNAVPGKAEYKGTFDPLVSETGWIEAVDDDISGWTTAYIFAHGVGCYYCE